MYLLGKLPISAQSDWHPWRKKFSLWFEQSLSFPQRFPFACATPATPWWHCGWPSHRCFSKLSSGYLEISKAWPPSTPEYCGSICSAFTLDYFQDGVLRGWFWLESVARRSKDMPGGNGACSFSWGLGWVLRCYSLQGCRSLGVTCLSSVDTESSWRLSTNLFVGHF